MGTRLGQLAAPENVCFDVDESAGADVLVRLGDGSLELDPRDAVGTVLEDIGSDKFSNLADICDLVTLDFAETRTSGVVGEIL